MKRFNLLALMMAIFIGSAIIFAGCTKEGPQGPPGKDGEDGVDGEDGTAGCIECHDDSQTIFAAENQWAASVHATGGNFERNGTDCAPCHTSQGFLEVIETGAMETEAPISNPNPQNCYTCHNIHDTYTPEDWSFTTSAPVEFWINGDGYDMGKSNVCAGCHQPRVPDPLPTPGQGGNVTINSPYWGPHHGPQAAMLVGTGGYEVGSGYDNSAHTNALENGCVTCHMAEPYGTQAGGHTMGMTYAYHGHGVVNKAGCTACHTDPDALDAKIESTKEDIDEKLAELRSKLLERGVLDSSDHVVPGEMSMDEAGGVFNYLYVMEDRSGGSHNFNYAFSLLNNSLESLN
ncbi:MAG: hypothetical protein K9I94_00645 [Bacteroidales bacterium]|nr:hypothetical protein [Bacteroidales bacterium]